MNLSCSTAMLIIREEGVSYALAVALFSKIRTGERITLIERNFNAKSN
jgi:hypothetical protein